MITDTTTTVVLRNTTAMYVKGTKVASATSTLRGHLQQVDAEMAAREAAIDAYSDTFGIIDWSNVTITSVFVTGSVTVEIAVSP